MSSSEECTIEGCGCHQQGSNKRPYNFYDMKTNLRHHHGKRRFPPRKKEQYIKEHSHKGKYILKRGPDFHNLLHEENRNQDATPNKGQKGEINPITKLNANTTYGIDAPYHAVGQSQRQKIMGLSPSPYAQNNWEAENREAPFTDRDRRIFSNPLRTNMMKRKRPTSNLDENFLKNFGNPENFMNLNAHEQKQRVGIDRKEGSASVQK